MGHPGGNGNTPRALVPPGILRELQVELEGVREAVQGSGYSLRLPDGQTIDRINVIDRVERLDAMLGRVVNVLIARGAVRPEELGLKPTTDGPRIVVP
jgi:hypothetical protein